MIIALNNIKLYAYHGCLEEEVLIGGNYSVDVIIHTDFSEAAQTDDLSKTVDYCDVYEIVKKEMAIRSKLIEHVAMRIGNALISSIKNIDKAEIHLTKIVPPMNGDVGSVTVRISVKK